MAVLGVGAKLLRETRTGKVFILDASMGYIGPLEGSEKVGGVGLSQAGRSSS